MKSMRLLVPGLMALLAASPAAADITLKSKASGTRMVGGVAGDTTQYVKGTRARTDQATGAGRQTSTIVDVATQKIIVLDHEKKLADIMDMAAIGDSMAKRAWRT